MPTIRKPKNPILERLIKENTHFEKNIFLIKENTDIKNELIRKLEEKKMSEKISTRLSQRQKIERNNDIYNQAISKSKISNELVTTWLEKIKRLTNTYNNATENHKTITKLINSITLSNPRYGTKIYNQYTSETIKHIKGLLFENKLSKEYLEWQDKLQEQLEQINNNKRHVR